MLSEGQIRGHSPTQTNTPSLIIEKKTIDPIFFFKIDKYKILIYITENHFLLLRVFLWEASIVVPNYSRM